MSKSFICGRTGSECVRQAQCAITNEKLIGAVTRITNEVAPGPGKRAAYAGACLVAELGRVGQTMMADFAPNHDNISATICPGDIIERGMRGQTPESIAQGVGFMASGAVEAVIRDLNVRQSRR